VDIRRRRAIHLDGSGKSSSFIKLRFSCSWTKRINLKNCLYSKCGTINL
jgi:hypothetical protein